MSKQIKSGDVVTGLAPDGVSLLVVRVIDQEAQCVWVKDEGIKVDNYRLEMLRVVARRDGAK